MKVLIDGDILRYRIGYSCESTIYTHRDFINQPIAGLTQFKEWLKEKGIDFKELKNDEHFITQSIATTDESCTTLCDDLITTILLRCKSENPNVYLTGSDNFREEIATIKPYKGNRTKERPHHYDLLTDHLIKTWKANVIEGMEADDALAIEQTSFPKHTSCIASIDKDLLQIPGRHYDFYHNKRLTISPEQALLNLYTQIIAGDATDNIGGVKGIGVKGAIKLLEAGTSEYEYYEIARKAYHDSFNKHEMNYGGLGPDEALLENARLVYLLRTPTDEWNPPTKPDGEPPSRRRSAN